MLDNWAAQRIKYPLTMTAAFLASRGVAANQMTLAGFVVGMLTLPFLAMQWYGAALICILLNRLADGLDGNIARMTTTTDAGAFLDISLDFIFYSAVVLGFALADPAANALAAAALIFSFIGTGSSFLAFAIMAERRKIRNIRFADKGFCYVDGLIEGTETLLFLILCCLLPAYFPILAWIFAGLCVFSTVIRLVSGYVALK
jgi:phosphatidylglycerophosphate synthase